MKINILGWRTRKKIIPLFLVAPAMVLLSVFMFYPIMFAGWISLHKWQLVGIKKYVGFANYAKLVGNRTVSDAVKVTLVYVVEYIPLTILLSLGFALLLTLNWRIVGRGFFKTCIFLASITPLLAMGLLWRFLYSYEYGILNYYLTVLGFQKIPWLNSYSLALPSVTIASIWHAIGWNMVIFIAGLQAIPEEYYQAARIDGAGGGAIFRYITLPLLKPVFLFVSITSSIAAFKMFGLFWGISEGGPGTSTTTLMIAVYKEAFIRFKLGMGSTLTFLLLAFIVGLTVIQLRVFRSETTY